MKDITDYIPISWRHEIVKYCGQVIIALFFVIEVIINWRRWGNIFLDFGREIYVPWQIVSGKTLYRDIAYFNGPLAPYLNATWFYIFGVSITTLFICNLILVAFVTFIIFRFFNRLCDKITATFACLFFLCIFVFPFSYVRIFNYVSPYDHDLTYGFVLAVTMIYLLSIFISTAIDNDHCCRNLCRVGISHQSRSLYFDINYRRGGDDYY